MLTFKELKESSVANVAGVCVTSTEFTALVNEATRRLLRRGDWSQSVIPIHVCVKRGCVVFPRYVGQVRKINLCHEPIPIRNLWYQFLPNQQSCWWRHYLDVRADCAMHSMGRSPVFSDIYGDGRLVRAYLTYNADVGKTVTIFGVDNNDQPLRTDNGDGTWDDGITLTLTKPYASTNTYVRRIDRVLKDPTEGDVRLYAYDATNDLLEDIALYEPSETNPDYAKYKIVAPSWPSTTTTTDTTSCCPSFGLLALVKLKFIPVQADNDLVLIDNVDAIKDMIQSIKFAEAGDYGNANNAESRAIRELNQQLHDDVPEDAVAVSNDVFSSAGLGYQTMF